MATQPDSAVVVSRAQQSLGSSEDAIYQMVARALRARHDGRGMLLDVGCGRGNLYEYVVHDFDRYVGSDVIRYDGFPGGAEFVGADLESGTVPLPTSSADVVAAVEVIEHLENPRAFVRELTRLVKPGGWVVVTTPNQLSFLSLVTLLVKHRFAAFQDVHYPAHLTALLEVDLERIASEAGLLETSVEHSRSGRIIMTPWHYPAPLARAFPRACSDNVLLIGRKLAE